LLYAEVAVEAGRSLDRETYSYQVPEGIDVVPGHGGMFSLEGPGGVRFLTRSRLYTDDESRQLETQQPQTGGTVAVL